MNLGCNGCGHRGHNAAIGQQPPLMLYRFEQAGERATGADGHVQRTPAKDVRRAAIKVGSHNSCCDGQVLYSAGAEAFLDKLADQILALRVAI